MRIRVGILVLALAAALSACSDDSDGGGSPDDPLTEMVIDCEEFQDTADRITQAQSDLYAGTGGPEAIDTLQAELEALKEDAPADVQAALTDMAAAFEQAAELLDQPTRKAQAELAELAPQLAEDSRTITEFVTSECE